MERATQRDYSIEAADLSSDRDAILEIGTRELPGFTHAHYSKYYEKNPCGTPTVFVARARDGRVVGLAALHPLRVVVDGTVVAAAVAGDFVVNPVDRGFGPALGLQRALLGAGTARGLEFTFGLPNEQSAGVLKRVGYFDLGPFARYARILSLRATVGTMRRKAGGSLRDLVPVRAEALRSAQRGYSAWLPRAFDDACGDVWQAWHRAARIVPQRTAEICNWKYEQGTSSSRFSVLGVYRGGSVAAYGVSYVQSAVRHIVELVWVDHASLRAILAAELERGRSERLAAIDLMLLGGHPDLRRVLADFGFSAVPTAVVRVFAPEDPRRALRDPAAWLLFEGAIDV